MRNEGVPRSSFLVPRFFLLAGPHPRSRLLLGWRGPQRGSRAGVPFARRSGRRRSLMLAGPHHYQGARGGTPPPRAGRSACRVAPG
jgi:hypothetical protein